MQRIAAALRRLNGTLDRRPDRGHYTLSTVTTLVQGLRCSTEAGGWTIPTDLRPAIGGDGSAPTPTMLLSSALGACLAMGYQLRAAEYGVELTSVRVTVETGSDVRGMLQCDAAVTPGFTEIRYRVEDLYGRPWAAVWEEHFEHGMQRPQREDIFDFERK